MRSDDDENEEAEISMSPLIDCVFLLLIFFLVSTMAKKQDKDIEINLPESISAEKKLPTNKQTVIGIDKEGNVFYDGHQATLMEVHNELRITSIETPELQIRIDTDAEAPLHKVIEIVDLCQFNNLSNVVLRTFDEHYNRH